MSSIVQIQWSLDNTIFKSADVLVKLFQAARDDDVQGPAVMALEALGSSLMICPDRLDEAKTALDRVGSFEVLRKMLVTVGFLPGGVAYFVRKTATQCLPAFALATSLKTFLGDEEIGNVLYSMLVCHGLHRKPELRCSRGQISKVVASLSGYTDCITPNATVQNLILALRSSSDPSAIWMKDALTLPSPDTLAKIYSAVYAALQNDEVGLVTLTGLPGCIIVASTLLWLQEDDAQLVVDNEVLIHSRDDPKISIQLSTKDSQKRTTWMIQEWREAATISSLVVEDENSPSRSLQLPRFTPASAAKELLKAQYDLSATEIAEVGKIATALALVATERGLVTIGPVTPGAVPREVKLQDICQTSYLSRVNECMTCYGWQEGEQDGAADLADEIKQWTEQGFPGLDPDKIKPPHPLTQKPIDVITWIVQFIVDRSHRKSGTADTPVAKGVAEAAVYVAAESLYTSICSRFPQQRFFRTGTFGYIAHNGGAMMHWIIRHEGLRGRTDIPPPMAKLVSHMMGTFTLPSLRRDCMGSLLPGASSDDFVSDTTGLPSDAVVHRRDLAYALNGYVVWLPQLRTISTLPREAVTVEVCAGYMRYDPPEADQESNTLLRIQADESRFEYSEGNGDGLPANGLNPFDAQGAYLGLGPFADTEGLEVKHYWSQTGRTLNLRTSILHPASGRICPVDWIASIDALARATHLANQHLASFVEKALAETWKLQGIWPTIFVVSVTTSIPEALGGGPFRYITRTRGSEELRFFLAGQAGLHSIYICHGDVSIAKCIQTALERETEHEGRMKAWSRFPGISTKVQPWMHPSIAEQIVAPGWVIIS